jgi:PhzF family phenazine biosynthesis protein
MYFPIYQADAFTDKLFKGNPAAVVPLDDEWLPDHTMQQIAAENNLSETAFLLREDEHFLIRWFTPQAEVKLCGHATLASAHILFTEMGIKGDIISFFSASGLLTVRKTGDKLQLDFPADFVTEVEKSQPLIDAIGTEPLEMYKGKTDYLLVYADEDAIRNIRPNHPQLRQTDARGIIVTAPGKTVDFVSRFFAPGVGIDEDPVTGSAHTLLVPYWAKRMGKNQLEALQLSARGGRLWCELSGSRVLIAGQAVTYLRGEFRY